MNEIGIICLIKILIEVYHFFLHNKIYAITKPFYERVTLVNAYQRMIQGYYRTIFFFEEHAGKNLYADFFSEHAREFSRLYDGIKYLPSDFDMMRLFFARLKPKTIQVVLMSCAIEIVYFILFIRLLFLLPYKLAFDLFIVIMLLSCAHAINEKGNKMKSYAYPLIDSLICIGIYSVLLFTLGIAAS